MRSRTPTTSSFSSTAFVPQSVMDGSDTARAATDDRGLARPRLVPILCEPRKPFEGEWSPSRSPGAHPARSTRAPDPTALVAAARLDDVPTALRSPLIIAGDAPIAARTASAIAPTVDYFPRDTQQRDVSVSRKKRRAVSLTPPLERARRGFGWNLRPRASRECRSVRNEVRTRPEPSHRSPREWRRRGAVDRFCRLATLCDLGTRLPDQKANVIHGSGECQTLTGCI